MLLAALRGELRASVDSRGAVAQFVRCVALRRAASAEIKKQRASCNPWPFIAMVALPAAYSRGKEVPTLPYIKGGGEGVRCECETRLEV